IEVDRQPCQPAQPEVCAPFERPGLELPVRQAAQHRFECSLPFNAGQRSAEAKVRGPTKRKMAIMGARNVEAIRIGKSLRVAISSRHHIYYGLAFFGALSA